MKRSNRLSVSIVIAFLLTLTLTVANESLFSSAEPAIIRLHILANSDSDEDQSLKLAVRDRLLAEVRVQCGEQDAPDAFLIAHTDWVRTVAEDEIRRRGYDYPVTVEFGRFAFPVKQYENYTFPAGMYDGMRVLIGAGAGQNWWCVMYPPLCFTGETKQVPPDAQARLSESADLYREQEQVIVRPKFKIKQWWDELAG